MGGGSAIVMENVAFESCKKKLYYILDDLSCICEHLVIGYICVKGFWIEYVVLREVLQGTFDCISRMESYSMKIESWNVKKFISTPSHKFVLE